MKLVKSLSVFGLIAVIVTACGSSVPTTVIGGYNQGAVGGQSGNTIAGTPITSGGTVTGYEATSAILGGYQQVYGNAINFTAQVNAGDKITVNLSSVQYIATEVECTGALHSIMSSSSGLGSPQTLSGATVQINGVAVNPGTQTVTTSGTLSLSATLTNTYVCPTNGPAATGLAFLVNFGTAITRTYCVDTNGVSMACP